MNTKLGYEITPVLTAKNSLKIINLYMNNSAYTARIGMPIRAYEI